MAEHETFKVLVEADRMELLLRYPFLGRVICQCELVPVQSPNAPIACNDCRRIYLSERAYTALSADVRLLVLAHEVLHITLRHAFRKGIRDEERFSFAADAEIFPLLRDEFPQASLRGYKKAWDGLTAEEIYELLPKKLPEKPPKHSFPMNTPNANPIPIHMKDGIPLGDNGDSGNDPDDSMSPSSGCDEEGEQNENPECRNNRSGNPKNDTNENNPDEAGDQTGKQTGKVSANSNGTGDRRTNDSDGDRGEPCDPQPAFDADTEMFCMNLSAELQNELKMRSGRGDTVGNLLRLLERINVPHIDWKSLLRQFIREVHGGSYHWLPPNRRFICKGLYLPGRRQKMFRGVVALDTSGSTIEALPDFVAEVERLMRSFGKFELAVIECDTAIGNVTVVSSDTKPYDWLKHRFSGGGGTDFTPVFDYIRNRRIRPDVLVFFTDGEGKCPKDRPNYPVLWLLTETGESPVPWGFHVKMKG